MHRPQMQLSVSRNEMEAISSCWGDSCFQCSQGHKMDFQVNLDYNSKQNKNIPYLVKIDITLLHKISRKIKTCKSNCLNKNHNHVFEILIFSLDNDFHVC